MFGFAYMTNPEEIVCAQMTMQGLTQKFSQAMAIMKWLSECAKTIAAEEQSVTWHTPLGLPVMQPYRNWVSIHSLVLVLIYHMWSSDMFTVDVKLLQ